MVKHTHRAMDHTDMFSINFNIKVNFIGHFFQIILQLIILVHNTKHRLTQIKYIS